MAKRTGGTGKTGTTARGVRRATRPVGTARGRSGGGKARRKSSLTGRLDVGSRARSGLSVRHARARPRPVRLESLTVAETVGVTFELRDVIGTPIRDPETRFTFRRMSDLRQIGNQYRREVKGVPLLFELPAVAGEVVLCEIDPKRYRFGHSTFFRSPGPIVRKSARLLREPDQWRPAFDTWDELSAGFDDLKRVLRDSPNVTLFREADPIAALLVGAAYDGVSGAPGILAKTALLNAYYRLSRTMEPISENTSWFSFVTRLVAIGRERFLAFVRPEMEALVRQIDSYRDEFRGEYEHALLGNHRDNVPTRLQGRMTSMVSIKSAHRKGNFQLTLTHLADPDEVLLDADIDESGDFLGHFADLLKHKVSGGTHPHDVHEILVAEAPTARPELGYRLV